MSCCVIGCRNRPGKSQDLHFYRIPSPKTPFDAKRRRLWLQAIKRTDWGDEISPNWRLCSAHFISGKPSMDPNNPDFVPSLFTYWQIEVMKAPQEMARFYRMRNRAIIKSSPDDTPSSLQAAPGSCTVQPTADSRQPCTNTQLVSKEVVPSLQPREIKIEQIPVLQETKVQEHPQIKEEQEDQSISPHMEADASNNIEVRSFKSEPDMEADTSISAEVRPKSEPTTDYELLPSSAAVTENVNESVGDKLIESDGSSSPLQSYSIEVYVDLEQPPREEKSCRFCGKRFKRDSHLIRHVSKSHKGNKAFKCLKCNKEFEQRHQLVLHVRIHTGEKPFSCDFCGKMFSQNSSRIVHMRLHTGEKPYLCKKCGKSFPSSKHFKFCKVQDESKVTPEKGSIDENHKDEKAFKCFECNKQFKQKHHLVLHMRVHTGEKPFKCDFCGKTFTQNSSRIVHMRQHTGEKPYYCNKCGKRFAVRYHLKYCTGRRNKSAKKSFRCAACGKKFHTDSDLKVHMEVHESWKRHISEKLQEQDLEEEKPEVV
uniref:zinc finger protein 436-like n=1 Tax=Scatophagus argus TaxID=75038 RepID=UPI001ED831BF|nr:zinc finger protein 436-like [Scatophagus argus]